MKRTTIFLADTQPERVKAQADRDGITSAEVIRQAIEVYLALRDAENRQLSESDEKPEVHE